MSSPSRLLFLGLLPALATACGSPRPTQDDATELPAYVDADAAAASAWRGAIPAEVLVPNFQPLSARVAAGGPPTAEQIAAMPSQGYATIINLRTDSEPGVDAEAKAAERAGLHYVRIPVSGSTLDLATASAVRQALRDAPDGDILLHCGSGNRVGAVWGLIQALDAGVSEDEAVETAYQSGMRSASLERAMREAIPPLERAPKR